MSFSILSPAETENPEYFRDRVQGLLVRAGFAGEFELVSLRGGANNRVFRAESGGRVALLKAYSHDSRDGRDRLRAEFAFSRFAWNMGLRCVPQPLGQDTENHLGLYEFMDGRAVRPEEID